MIFPEDGTHDGRTRAAASRVRAPRKCHVSLFSLFPHHGSAKRLSAAGVQVSIDGTRSSTRATPRRWIRNDTVDMNAARVDRIARVGDERDPRPAPPPRRRGSRADDRHLRRAHARAMRANRGRIGRRREEPASLPLAPRSSRSRPSPPRSSRPSPPPLVAADPARADTECTECSNATRLSRLGTSPSSNPRRERDPRGPARGHRRDAPARPDRRRRVGRVHQRVPGQEDLSTRETDAPFAFKLGAGEAMPAFEEAVSQMRVGGIRRPPPASSRRSSRTRGTRASGTPSGRCRRRWAGGARDFVLDNRTLKDFNRTLLFDIRLSAIRK